MPVIPSYFQLIVLYKSCIYLVFLFKEDNTEHDVPSAGLTKESFEQVNCNRKTNKMND